MILDKRGEMAYDLAAESPKRKQKWRE